MDDIYERLKSHTYRLEHNPACPQPYLVRIPGYWVGFIDGKEPAKTADAFGFGATFEEAAHAAFLMHARQHREGLPSLARLS